MGVQLRKKSSSFDKKKKAVSSRKQYQKIPSETITRTYIWEGKPAAMYRLGTELLGKDRTTRYVKIEDMGVKKWIIKK